jgi:hypothetical protein
MVSHLDRNVGSRDCRIDAVERRLRGGFDILSAFRIKITPNPEKALRIHHLRAPANMALHIRGSLMPEESQMLHIAREHFVSTHRIRGGLSQIMWFRAQFLGDLRAHFLRFDVDCRDCAEGPIT